jgi:hypothetical protein
MPPARAPGPARGLPFLAGSIGSDARHPAHRSSPCPRTDAGAWTAPRPRTGSASQARAGPGQIRWVLLSPTTRTGPANPASQSAIRVIAGRQALTQNPSGLPVDGAALRTARVEIQTHIGTLIHDWNVQTFNCGTTRTGNPRTSLNSGYESYAKQPHTSYCLAAGEPVTLHQERIPYWRSD